MSREVERDAEGSWPEADGDGDGGAYRSLLATLGLAMFRVDADARLEAINEDFAAITGHPAERLEGAHVATVLASGDGDRFERALQAGGEHPDDVLDITLQPTDGDPMAATVSSRRGPTRGRYSRRCAATSPTQRCSPAAR